MENVAVVDLSQVCCHGLRWVGFHSPGSRRVWRPSRRFCSGLRAGRLALRGCLWGRRRGARGVRRLKLASGCDTSEVLCSSQRAQLGSRADHRRPRKIPARQGRIAADTATMDPGRRPLDRGAGADLGSLRGKQLFAVSFGGRFRGTARGSLGVSSKHLHAKSGVRRKSTPPPRILSRKPTLCSRPRLLFDRGSEGQVVDDAAPRPWWNFEARHQSSQQPLRPEASARCWPGWKSGTAHLANRLSAPPPQDDPSPTHTPIRGSHPES